MKTIYRILTSAIILVLFLAVPTSVLAQPPGQTGGTISGDQVIFGDSYILKAGQTLNGDLVVLGGNATIETGASVNGDVAVLGGNVDLAGTVNGDVAAIGANVTLSKGGLVTGEVVSMGGNVVGQDVGTIRGGIRTFTPRAFMFDKNAFHFPQTGGVETTSTVGGWILSVLGKIMQILAMAVLAVIVVLLLPRPINRVADTIVNQPWVSGGAGFLAFLATPFVLLILTITIILIPVTILAALALAVAVIFGWIAIGFQVGRRLEVIFKSQWADGVSAGVGTLVLGIVVWVLGFVPCVGWLLGFVAACIGLGGVILSGFGTRISTSSGGHPAPVIEVVPPASPAPTATRGSSSEDTQSTEQ
jgi:hypothetical protein